MDCFWIWITLTTAFCLTQVDSSHYSHSHREHHTIPEFIEPIKNVTIPAGRDAILACLVKDLGKNKVGWLKSSDQTVLALEDKVVTHNSRITIIIEDASTWKLKIKQVKESDRGCYMCQINTSPMKKQIGCVEIQVPPDIKNDDSSADMAVLEGEDATLSCRATGNPPPRIIWKREDGEMIYMRKAIMRDMIKTESFNGTTLKLLKVERKQMGPYMCIATNDVPPTVSKRMSLIVQFAPMVRAPSQLLGAPYGSDVTLKCQIEASPMPVSYWLRANEQPSKASHSSQEKSTPSSSYSSYGGFGGALQSNSGDSFNLQHSEMLLDGPKYAITETHNGYKASMVLIVRNFSKPDDGSYYCVSTNSLGRAEGAIRLYEIKLPSTTVSNSFRNSANNKGPNLNNLHPSSILLFLAAYIVEMMKTTPLPR